jgi:uncharacterized protein
VNFVHAPFVSDNVHTPVDPVKLAREHECVEGQLDLNLLPRLADMLSGGPGEVSYRVQGWTTPTGQPALHVKLWGELTLRCQRCLEPMSVKVDAQRDLVFAADADPFVPDEDEDDNTDVIPLAEVGDLQDLLEQELVLSLPMVPHHEGACPAPLAGAGMGARASPFAVLAGNKRH